MLDAGCWMLDPGRKIDLFFYPASSDQQPATNGMSCTNRPSTRSIPKRRPRRHTFRCFWSLKRTSGVRPYSPYTRGNRHRFPAL